MGGGGAVERLDGGRGGGDGPEVERLAGAQDDRGQGQHRRRWGRCRRTPRAPTRRPGVGGAGGGDRLRPRARPPGRAAARAPAPQRLGPRAAGVAGRPSARSWSRWIVAAGAAETSVRQGRHRQAAGGQRGAAAGIEVEPSSTTAARPSDTARSARSSGAAAPEAGRDRRRPAAAARRAGRRGRRGTRRPARGGRAPRPAPRTGPDDPPRWPDPRRSARRRSAGGGRGGHVGGWGRAGRAPVWPPWWARRPPVPPACTAGVCPVNSARPGLRR